MSDFADVFDDLPVFRGVKRTYSRRCLDATTTTTQARTDSGLATPPASSSPPPLSPMICKVDARPIRLSSPPPKMARLSSRARPLAALTQRSGNPITMKKKKKTPHVRPKLRATDGKVNGKGKGLVQMHLNLLPAHVTCRECGMSYNRTTPSDVTLHNTFHTSHLAGIQLPTTTTTASLAHLRDGTHRLTCTRPSERSLIEKCCSLVDAELSASLSPLTNAFSAFVDVWEHRVRSFIVVQPIRQARRLVPSSGELEDEPRNDVVMGVNRMWTSRRARGQGRVRVLLDHALACFVHGCRLDKADVAFTQLSDSGLAAVRKWVGGQSGDVLIYCD